MSEINNDNVCIFGKDIGIRGNNIKNFKSENTHEVKLQIQDLGNNPTDYIGRSLVKKFNTTTFKGKMYLKIRSDIYVFTKNPELVNKSEVVFDKTYTAGQKAGNKDAYGNAVATQAAFVEEFNR